MKSKCLTFFRTKGKAIAITLNDSDEDGNLFAFTATAVVNESDSVEEKPFDGELFESVDLQETYNKLCKVAANDTMNMDLGLKKIVILEQEKKTCC